MYINKTSSDNNTFNLTGLCFKLKIDNSNVRHGFENEKTPKDNNQWMWLPQKCTERWSIIDIANIFRPLEIKLNEDYLPTK